MIELVVFLAYIIEIILHHIQIFFLLLQMQWLILEEAIVSSLFLGQVKFEVKQRNGILVSHKLLV